MAEQEKRGRVLILTEQYRILGEIKFGPDGSAWDFRHRVDERLITVYDAQFFSLVDGKRVYDAGAAEINRDAVIAVFKEQDLAFVRKIQ